VDELALRQAIIDKCLYMNASGLNQGTSGNISVRHGDRMLITPTSTPYNTLKPEHIVSMPIDAEDGRFDGPLKPSVEWHFHRRILHERPEIGAVVHTHSTHATALAMTRRSIPACHYMVGVFGGNDIRCSGYARYGTSALSDAVVQALEGRLGCLMANHGMLAIGTDLEKAMWLAVELETVARQYMLTLQIGGPVLLTDAEMDEARKGFGTYGLKSKPAGSKAA
jgi:L-fuculose-phosphate aldolase